MLIGESFSQRQLHHNSSAPSNSDSSVAALQKTAGSQSGIDDPFHAMNGPPMDESIYRSSAAQPTRTAGNLPHRPEENNQPLFAATKFL
jgi:hypothetical protein